MKTSRLLLVLAFVLQLMALVSSSAHAEKMDTETHTLVIEKLERSLHEASEDDTLSLRPVRARLADLYAERARLRAMSEAEKNCGNCTGAIEDRRRALKIYETVLAESEQEQKGTILIQMAHLHELLLENKAAEALYERIVREGGAKHSRGTLAQGYIGRAEMRFARGEFKDAKADFETASKLSPAGKKGELLYRVAWCHLNLGDQPKAVATLVHILKTPELLSRESTQGAGLDLSFQEDVSRDLATFVARGAVSAREIRMIETLSPERARLANIKHLASELERLGAKPAALSAWAVYLQNESSKMEKLEAMVRITQIRFDLGQRAESLAAMKRATTFWKENGCEGEAECALLQARLRKVVVDWNRIEKKAPSVGLLAAYQTYLTQFDRDAEMTYWAALIAKDLRHASEAASLYHKSSELAAQQAPNAETKKLLEASLVGEVEMAELAKSATLREAAYDHYLKLNPQGAIATQIRYQRARVAYERGDNKEASARLHEFATSETCHKSAKGETADLCLKAADLDLDALALMKDDRLIEERALEYAPRYSGRRIEYLKLARTSVLKQASTLEASVALKKLGSANMAGASEEERIRFYKTQLSLAEKAQDLDATRAAAQGLFAIRGLSETDHEMALSKIAWVAEMRLDFKEAYAISRRMKMPRLSSEEKAMRLALLAELAGQSPRPHEEEFLRLSRSSARRVFVQAKLVRSAKNPLAELRKYESDLKRRPAIYAPLALEIYAKTGSRGFAEQALRVRGVVNEPAGRMLSRQLFLRDFAQTDAVLANHVLRAQSDALLKRTMSERMKLIAQAEKAASIAISSRDTELQLVTLAVVSRENKRVHDDILALPVPRQLKTKDRATYLKLVEAQARPYANKHAEIEKKLEVLWSDTKFFEALNEEYSSARPFMKPLYAYEMKKIATVAPSSVRGKMERALEDGSDEPAASAIASARQEVRERPFNENSLLKLKDLEAGRGREVMVVYLDARLLKLKEEGVRR